MRPVEAATRERELLAATDQGIYHIAEDGTVRPLHTGQEVRKLVRAGSSWFSLGTEGILHSDNLSAWETRNAGLPVKVLKTYEGGAKSFTRVVQELKDLEVNPSNPDVLVTATKDAIFLSKDGGKSWKDLNFPARTNGIKAVAVVDLEGTIVFATHAIYGVYWCAVDSKTPRWNELNKGLAVLETTSNPDEVSDIATFLPPGAPAGTPPRVFASQTFKPRIYELDWKAKAFIPVWQVSGEVGTVDSLNPDAGSLRFVHDGAIAALSLPNHSFTAREDLARIAANTATKLGLNLEALASLDGEFCLSELWLVNGTRGATTSPAALRRSRASGHEGLYLPVNHAADPDILPRYLRLIDDRKLNMVVVDMKDDTGRLRWNVKNPAIREKGRIFNPIDIESFCSKMKTHGVWTVARVVVFKDEELARKFGGKYAVWDTAANAPWQGCFWSKKKAEGSDPAQKTVVKSLSQEHWVDPYCQEVWEYIAAISKELSERGFDEIQYDYIRFPTDGDNLSSAAFRWQDPGMDKESAILSFLSHVRSRISVPLSVDIYGANSWYRTGSRTGQEVELLSHYVDVICPMYYPSHFEQDFLSQPPEDQRPYRIYYRGTVRTDRIARSQVLVRPYLQAFFMNVSYDRKYYGTAYVKLQVDGTRKAGQSGLTYWNNGGRYDDIPRPASFGEISPTRL